MMLRYKTLMVFCSIIVFACRFKRVRGRKKCSVGGVRKVICSSGYLDKGGALSQRNETAPGPLFQVGRST